MCGVAMLVPSSTAYVLGGYEDRTVCPGATMSGLIRVPWKDAGPRLLKLASVFDCVVAPTVNDSSYCAGGPSLPMVWHIGPELPAATTGTMPAARTFWTAVSRMDWFGHSPSEIEQYHELLMATGALAGSGFCPSRFHGAIMNSRQPMYVSGVPSPLEFIDRHPIHLAPGATPIWFVPPSSPMIVPTVWVPWPFGPTGARFAGLVSSYQLQLWCPTAPFHPA